MRVEDRRELLQERKGAGEPVDGGAEEAWGLCHWEWRLRGCAGKHLWRSEEDNGEANADGRPHG